MADEPLSSDQLIQLLESLANEYAPLEAAEFSTSARDDLAELRQSDHAGQTLDRLGTVLIPERYADRPDLFVVFDAFARIFVQPIATAAGALQILGDSTWGSDIRTLSFARSGEPDPSDDRLLASDAAVLAQDETALQEMASEIGSELFGQTFRSTDFWRER